MEQEETSQEAFVAFGKEAASYDQNYRVDGDRYPDHVYRLRIFEALLEKLRPQTVLDAGCGSGVPLISFLNSGLDAYGFDRSAEMVAETRERLRASRHNPMRVFQGDLDDFENPINRHFDAVVGLGSVYYTPDTQQTIRNLAASVRAGGDLIFSLRNELFSLCSLNEYSADYLLRTIFPIGESSESLKSVILEFFTQRFPKMSVEKLFENVDERKIQSHLHNPLTVEEQLLTPNDLQLMGLYYYHFHALPPIFEHSHQQEFYALSARRENPNDWRGIVSASCFVVHARKPSP